MVLHFHYNRVTFENCQKQTSKNKTYKSRTCGNRKKTELINQEEKVKKIAIYSCPNIY